MIEKQPDPALPIFFRPSLTLYLTIGSTLRLCRSVNLPKMLEWQFRPFAFTSDEACYRRHLVRIPGTGSIARATCVGCNSYDKQSGWGFHSRRSSQFCKWEPVAPVRAKKSSALPNDIWSKRNSKSAIWLDSAMNFLEPSHSGGAQKGAPFLVMRFAY